MSESRQHAINKVICEAQQWNFGPTDSKIMEKE